MLTHKSTYVEIAKIYALFLVKNSFYNIPRSRNFGGDLEFHLFCNGKKVINTGYLKENTLFHNNVTVSSQHAFNMKTRAKHMKTCQKTTFWRPSWIFGHLNWSRLFLSTINGFLMSQNIRKGTIAQICAFVPCQALVLEYSSN